MGDELGSSAVPQSVSKLDGRIALITGAGTGIGAAIANTFADHGATVWVSDIDEGAAQTVADEIKRTHSEARVFVCRADVTNSDDVAALISAIREKHGELHCLVNNAGLNVRTDFRHMTDDDWLKIRTTNLDSAIRLARDCFDLLKASGNGSILNLSSIMGRRSLRQLAAYSVTKGAVSALTRSLAVEYAPFNIRVNALAPGFIATNLTQRFVRNPLVSKALIDQTPMKRFGAPQDVANAALFLSSDDAGFITGSELTVDGGMTAAL